MRVELNQEVKHDGVVYHKGDTMTVADDLGRYFVDCGWASSDGKVVVRPPGHVSLTVQSATHKAGAKFHG